MSSMVRIIDSRGGAERPAFPGERWCRSSKPQRRNRHPAPWLCV